MEGVDSMNSEPQYVWLLWFTQDRMTKWPSMYLIGVFDDIEHAKAIAENESDMESYDCLVWAGAEPWEARSLSELIAKDRGIGSWVLKRETMNATIQEPEPSFVRK
jgi:hypothetical protein